MSARIWKLQKPFLAMLYWRKELEMLSRILKSYEVKNVNAVVDAYPCDEDIAKPNKVIFQLSKKILIGKGSITELRLGML